MHVGFIMDGNRRWARKNAMEIALGHTHGGDIIEHVVEWCVDERIECMSLWALARQNILKRDPVELAHIYHILDTRVPALVPKLLKWGVRFETIGDLSLLPVASRDVLSRARRDTADGTVMTCILVIGYGGRDEIVRGIRDLVSTHRTIESLRTTLDSLTEESLKTYLDSGRFPDPDLVIRTGGDHRSSGFLLYGCEYAEYAFTDTLWPDFTHAELRRVLEDFRNAKRNFGK